MSEHPELSRLPTDEKYWEGLEARILASLEIGREPVRDNAEWWAPLAERAYALGALAVTAAVAALLLSSSTREPASAGLLRLPDEDPQLAGLLSAESPPSLVNLVIPSRRSPK
jgi:hypothetical protein